MNFCNFRSYLFFCKSSELECECYHFENLHNALIELGFVFTIVDKVGYIKPIVLNNKQYIISVYTEDNSICMELNNFKEKRIISKRHLSNDFTLDIIGELFEQCLDYGNIEYEEKYLNFIKDKK